MPRTRTRRHTGKKPRKTRTYTRKRPVMTGGSLFGLGGGSKRPNKVSSSKNALTIEQSNKYTEKKGAGLGSYALARVNKALGSGPSGLFGLWGERQAKKQGLIQAAQANDINFTVNPAYVPPKTI